MAYTVMAYLVMAYLLWLLQGRGTLWRRRPRHAAMGAQMSGLAMAAQPMSMAEARRPARPHAGHLLARPPARLRARPPVRLPARSKMYFEASGDPQIGSSEKKVHCP